MAKVVLPDDLKERGYVTFNVAVGLKKTTLGTLLRYVDDKGIDTRTFTPREIPYIIVRVRDLEGFESWRSRRIVGSATSSDNGSDIPEQVDSGSAVEKSNNGYLTLKEFVAEAGRSATSWVYGERDRGRLVIEKVDGRNMVKRKYLNQYIGDQVYGNGHQASPDEPVESEMDRYVTVDEFAELSGVPADDLEALFKYGFIDGGEMLVIGRIKDGKVYIDRQRNGEVVRMYNEGDIDWDKILSQLNNEWPNWRDEVFRQADTIVEQEETGESPPELEGEVLSEKDIETDDETEAAPVYIPKAASRRRSDIDEIYAKRMADIIYRPLKPGEKSVNPIDFEDTTYREFRRMYPKLKYPDGVLDFIKSMARRIREDGV